MSNDVEWMEALFHKTKVISFFISRWYIELGAWLWYQKCFDYYVLRICVCTDCERMDGWAKQNMRKCSVRCLHAIPIYLLIPFNFDSRLERCRWPKHLLNDWVWAMFFFCFLLFSLLWFYLMLIFFINTKKKKKNSTTYNKTLFVFWNLRLSEYQANNGKNVVYSADMCDHFR